MFFCVVFGAFGAHILKHQVSEKAFNTFETGLRYHFYHSLALLFLSSNKVLSKFKTPFILLIGGVLFFSGNCYLYAISEVKTFALLIPLGGTLMSIGWLLFASKLLNLNNFYRP